LNNQESNNHSGQHHEDQSSAASFNIHLQCFLHIGGRFSKDADLSNMALLLFFWNCPVKHMTTPIHSPKLMIAFWQMQSKFDRQNARTLSEGKESNEKMQSRREQDAKIKAFVDCIKGASDHEGEWLDKINPRNCAQESSSDLPQTISGLISK
jgi:hypothetical protein